MAETTHGKYKLRRRDNLPDYKLFQADFESDIDSEVGDSDDIGVEISDEAFPDESNVDFVDDTIVLRDVVENRDNVAISTPSREKQNNNPIPNGWDDRNWTDGDMHWSLFPQFIENSSILVDIPDDADELYFFSLFINDDLLNNVVLETNRYAKDYITIEKEKGRLPPKSTFKSWPEEGITTEKFKKFIALTFYFGFVKKDNVKSYWSTNSILPTLFPKKGMNHDEFLNIFRLFIYVTIKHM